VEAPEGSRNVGKRREHISSLLQRSRGSGDIEDSFIGKCRRYRGSSIHGDGGPSLTLMSPRSGASKQAPIRGAPHIKPLPR